MTAWPITQQAETGQDLEKPIVFPRLSFRGLTPLIAFSVTSKIGHKERTAVFVMNIPMQGAPEDRQDRVYAPSSRIVTSCSVISSFFCCGDEGAASSGELRRLLESPGMAQSAARTIPIYWKPCYVRLHRSPAQLERVSSLLEVLRKQEGSSELLSEDFQKIWEPIWEVASRTWRNDPTPDTTSALNGLKDFSATL